MSTAGRYDKPGLTRESVNRICANCGRPWRSHIEGHEGEILCIGGIGLFEEPVASPDRRRDG